MLILDSKGKRLDRTVVVDVETTGLFPEDGDRIIEVGAVALERGKIVDEFESLVNVDHPITIEAQAVHGITQAMLKGQPYPSVVLPKFHRFIRDSIIVAHNADYDMKFIMNEFVMLGLGLNNYCYCTMTLGRRLFPLLAGHDLETLYRHLYKRSPRRLHRALFDARTTAKIWIKIVGMI